MSWASSAKQLHYPPYAGYSQLRSTVPLRRHFHVQHRDKAIRLLSFQGTSRVNIPAAVS